jgi:hypothetical protein
MPTTTSAKDKRTDDVKTESADPFFSIAFPTPEKASSSSISAGADGAGQRAAAMMSLIPSATLSGQELCRHLKDFLERVPTQPAETVVLRGLLSGLGRHDLAGRDL